MSLEQLVGYQARLKGKCSLGVKYDSLFARWTATVETEENVFPYWQQAHGVTPTEAWDSLRGFLDGGPQLHGRSPIQASDFLQPAAATDEANRRVT